MLFFASHKILSLSHQIYGNVSSWFRKRLMFTYSRNFLKKAFLRLVDYFKRHAIIVD